MQKEMLSGFAKLQKAARCILIPGCHVLLQVCRSLCFLWLDGDTLEASLGVSKERLQNLIDQLEKFRFTLEHFVIATQSAQQDFFLLCVWLLEQVVIHTKSTRDAESEERILAEVQRHKTVSNQWQLGIFLENAIKKAFLYREYGNKSMELTFGNPVIPFFVPDEMQREECLQTLVTYINELRKEWLDMFTCIVRELSSQVKVDLETSLVFDQCENECTLDFDVSSPEMEDLDADEFDDLSNWMEMEARKHRCDVTSPIMRPMLSMTVNSNRLFVCRYAQNQWEYCCLQTERTSDRLVKARYFGHTKAKTKEQFVLLFSRGEKANETSQGRSNISDWHR